MSVCEPRNPRLDAVLTKMLTPLFRDSNNKVPNVCNPLRISNTVSWSTSPSQVLPDQHLLPTPLSTIFYFFTRVFLGTDALAPLTFTIFTKAILSKTNQADGTKPLDHKANQNRYCRQKTYMGTLWAEGRSQEQTQTYNQGVFRKVLQTVEKTHLSVKGVG